MEKNTNTPPKGGPRRFLNGSLSFAWLAGLVRPKNEDGTGLKATPAPADSPRLDTLPITAPMSEGLTGRHRESPGVATTTRRYAKQLELNRPRAHVAAAPVRSPRAAAPAQDISADLIDDDPDDEMTGRSLTALARLRERARCEAIVLSDAGLANPALAANLAFKTRMSRLEALALLASVPAPARRKPNQSADAPTLSQRNAVDASWDRAFHVAAGMPGGARQPRQLPASNTGPSRATGAPGAVGRG
jgi:hypothetical protein